MYQLTKDLFRIPMKAEEVLCSTVYESEALKEFTEEPVKSPKIEEVYGHLKFPKAPADRPYVYASFITTIDGKIAFQDARDSALLQTNNFLDKTGGNAPFFVFMLQRAAADAVICGAGTMREEPNMTVHLYDVDLEQARIDNGLPPVPLNIISTLDGTDLLFDHTIFKKDEVPKMINTSPVGWEVVREKCQNPIFLVGPYRTMEDVDFVKLDLLLEENKGKIPVVVTGEGAQTDSNILFRILRHMGIERLLIETPVYTHHLMMNGLMDELFLNYACIYVGGGAMSIGLHSKSCTSTDHPHTKMLSIVNAKASPDHWFCFREAVIHGVKGRE
ncbi:RibD family protein [Hungatella effluvii]|uniref:RibD family protein n=1 Tax=Hungatella effluvii TaxID=1096246 RepID=UPI0022E77A1F|nr:dihydrofolate reductase family protein [Hungatella effluvii]